MRKFLITVLAVVCLACLGIVAACSESPYYTLNYDVCEGVSIQSNAPAGAGVREGFGVSFTLTVDDGYIGDPVVTVNGNVLKPDGEGVYSFEMKEETTVKVSEVYKLNTYLVVFDRGGDDWVWFSSEYGDTEEGISVNAGDTITFTVKASVYYGDKDYKVLANTTLLNPDENGVYTLSVTGNTTVTISGLDPDDPDTAFYAREDGGSGTVDDPYKISRPIDLFAMYTLVNSSYYNSFSNAYYSLENDIDMKGEQIFIIGDGNYSFSGDFNGNGHTISNYFIADNYVEQESYLTVFSPYIGLFGYATMASIYDLNLENFSIDVNAATVESGFYAGGLVGFGYGVNITNCSVSGTITADADENYFGYIGGIIAGQNSYSDGATIYYSSVRSCSSDVTISGESGYIYTAGGIAGEVTSYNSQVSSFILNCYSTGNISGAMNAGGIAGYVDPYGSIKGCYATGIIEADNRIPVMSSYEYYSYAYAGGIAGYVDYGSVVSDCFFTGKTYATTKATEAGYAQAGDIVGAKGAASKQYVESGDAIVLNCYYDANITDAFIQNTLNWGTGDWKFNGDGRPVINAESATKTFTLTINLGAEKYDGKNTVAYTITDMYVPMSYWYLIEEGASEFISTDGGLRSYGYFFDAALTQKVPYSYVPTDDVTIYAGFANYADVAGRYYFVNGNGSYMELDADGVLYYRDGALIYKTYYSYDGATIILGGFPALGVTETTGYDANLNPVYTYGYYAGKADLNGNTLTIINMDEIGSTVNTDESNIYTSASPLYALKEIENFAYGTYYTAGNVSYTFYGDGTGVTGNNPFTYAYSNGVITITLKDDSLSAIVEDGVITKIGGVNVTLTDAFAGVWENNAGYGTQYTFDGKGGWSRDQYSFAGGKKVVEVKESGTYELLSSTSILLDNNLTVKLDENGFIVVGDATYYRQNSFAGTWYFRGVQQSAELVLEGITSEGYGAASVNFGSFYGKYELTYSATASDNGNTVHILLYFEDAQFGDLVFDADNKTLVGSIFYPKTSTLSLYSIFCLYDAYKGVWENEELGTIEFNGFGNYSLKGTSDMIAVSGSVKINGTSVSYTLDAFTLKGSFTLNGVEYETEFDEVNNVIILTADGVTYVLGQADAE